MIKNLASLQARAEAFTDVYKAAMIAPPVTVAFATDVRDALNIAEKMQDALAAILAECHESRLNGHPYPTVYVDSIEQTIKIFMEDK